MNDTQAKLDANKAKLDELTAHRDHTNGRIDELQKIIAEEQKPEPRDGDYGPDKNGGMSVAMASGGGKFYYHHRGMNSNHPAYAPVTILGNIFDDLGALQEDLTKVTIFEDVFSDVELELVGRDIHIRQQGQSVVMRNMSILALNAKKIEATLQRRSK